MKTEHGWLRRNDALSWTIALGYYYGLALLDEDTVVAARRINLTPRD